MANQSAHGRARRRPGSAVVASAVTSAVILGALAAFTLTRDDDSQPGGVAAAPSLAATAPGTSASPPPSAASGPSPSPATALAVASPAASPRPVAVGRGRPSCNGGPCDVRHRLTRSFLPQYGGQQTLLLARSEDADANGSRLHAFLVDPDGRVLWEEHGFGWEFYPVDEQFAIRFDEAQHVFFRAYVADNTYLYVLDLSGPAPRLVGPNGRDGDGGFANGRIVERAGEAAFAIREVSDDCALDDETCVPEETLFRWNGTVYVAT